MTGIKEIDDLIRVMNNGTAPKWKRESAKRRFIPIKRKYDLIREAIEENDDYPYERIRRIVRGHI